MSDTRRTEGADPDGPRSAEAARAQPGYQQLNVGSRDEGPGGMRTKLQGFTWMWWVGGLIVLIVLAAIFS